MSPTDAETDSTMAPRRQTFTVHVPVTSHSAILGVVYHRPWLADSLAEALEAFSKPFWPGQPVFLSAAVARIWVAHVEAAYPLPGPWSIEPCEVWLQRYTDGSTRLFFQSSGLPGVSW